MMSGLKKKIQDSNNQNAQVEGSYRYPPFMYGLYFPISCGPPDDISYTYS